MLTGCVPPPFPAMPSTFSVLLAEDEPSNRKLIEIYLRKLGLPCESVARGSELATRLQERAYDLVLTDVRMPDVDGLTIVRALRAGEYGPLNRDTRVVVLSALAFLRDVQVALRAGANAYVTKPFSLHELAGAVRPAETPERLTA